MKRKLRTRTVTNINALANSPLAAWLKRRHYSLKGLTISYLLPLPKRSLGKRALKLAASQIGTHEIGTTNDVKFNTWYYGKRVSGLPYSWCATFVSWVLTHIGLTFKYAYVPYVVNDARAKKNGLSTILFGQVPAALKAGQVVLACYDWPGESKGLADHIGIVEKVLSSTTFQAIEGNTSLANQSNGGEVMRRVRSTSDVQVFVLVSKPAA